MTKLITDIYSFMENAIKMPQFSILCIFYFFNHTLLVLYHNLGYYILCGGKHEIQRLLTTSTLIFNGMLWKTSFTQSVKLINYISLVFLDHQLWWSHFFNQKSPIIMILIHTESATYTNIFLFLRNRYYWNCNNSEIFWSIT